MVSSRKPRNLLLPIAVALPVFCLAILSTPGYGFTPQSPEVKAMINKGLGFLVASEKDGTLRDHSLSGLCLLKDGQKDHKLVARVAAEFDPTTLDYFSNYETAILMMFFAELHEPQLSNKLQATVDITIKRQEKHGGWGYAKGVAGPMDTGDISQTQLVIMALWSAKNSGANVPNESIIKALNFLIRVQDPSGAWGYQGVDPGGFTRVAQTEVRNSLAVGGWGATLIAADLLHFGAGTKAPVPTRASNVPAALQVAKDDKAVGLKGREPLTKEVDSGRVDTAVRDGRAWIQANQEPDVKGWPTYYLYGRERAEAFHELYVGKADPNPAWYDMGVNFLMKYQDADGGWGGKMDHVEHSRVSQTALAVMFLMRSTERTIVKVKKLGEGHLTSGVGLPADIANAGTKGGKIVDSRAIAEVTSVKELLDDPENSEVARLLEFNESVKFSEDISKRASEVDQLRKLVSHEKFEPRLAAVKLLSKDRNFDNVPVLIYALSDPDHRIVVEADAGLRFISRKFGGVGMPVPPTSEQDTRKAREGWRDWFLTIRPDAKFID